MYFDSQNIRCKSPFGAVSCGTEVSFCLFASAEEAVIGAELLCYDEFADRWTQTPLSPVGQNGGRAFAGTYTVPAEATLIWYHFRLQWEDGGSCCFGKNGMQAWNAVDPWQLTVYRKEPRTPQWFGGGVTYQIFPDRFCRSRLRPVDGLIGRRSLHAQWDDLPDYLPNADGEITNSDFFGGDLNGIREKLPYLASLGVTTLYLNPIFESASNHRYDTADYRRIDPLLGTEEDFRQLCRAAHGLGMRVLLDGVFNHTGAESVYFNRSGFYAEKGAYQSTDSPYFPWYHFSSWPKSYDAWWGIATLPAVNESEESYVNFVVRDADSVVRRWLRCGADGWRLDVADELPDSFIAEIRKAIEEEKPDGFLLGEVWEDGSNKIAYGQRRRYLLGEETHGLMNYPFRTAAIAYLRGGDAADFRETMEVLRENYPPEAFLSAMNFLSTHDTPRILTALGLSGEAPASRDARAAYRLNDAELARGLTLSRLAALLQFTFPGAPSVFYGDEAGMQGFEDPFNRGTFPWGRENADLTAWYARLGALRRKHEALRRGTIEYAAAQGGLLAFFRRSDAETTLTVLNAGSAPVSLSVPWQGAEAFDLLGETAVPVETSGVLSLSVPPLTALLFGSRKETG